VPGVLRVERRDDGVALVTLNRPDKRNALSIELREALAEAFGDAGDVGCFVLTGAGSAFCAGMDTTQFGGDGANREKLVSSSVAAFEAVALCPAPVVAAVNGPAVAGGFALALLCDVRIAGPAATFAFAELGRGIPSSYGAARAALAPAVARDLALTGRTIGAGEALRLGVVGEVVDEPVARALELAASIPEASRAVKARILHEGETTWRRALEREHDELRDALLGADQ
jgi:enoyl-CoA hydratase/carnithine racemase